MHFYAASLFSPRAILASLVLKEAFLASQLFAKKSIDKLISDSEDPAHRLKKTLGPWSLTVLGIGAIIGSGIFALTGTAAAGESGDPSFYKVQVLDLFMHLVHGGGLHDIVMYADRPPVQRLRFRSCWLLWPAFLPDSAMPNWLR